MNERGEFEGWLEEALKRNLDPVVSRRTRASQPRYKSLAGRGRARRVSLLGGGASTAVAAKVATGLTVAAFAVGATGTALSGTPNPIEWRQQVSHRVEQCQAGLTADAHGLGDCISVFAGQNGDQPGAHSAAPTTAPETREAASEAREIPSAPSAQGIIAVPKPTETPERPVVGRPVKSKRIPEPHRTPLPEKIRQPDHRPDGQRPSQSDDIDL